MLTLDGNSERMHSRPEGMGDLETGQGRAALGAPTLAGLTIRLWGGVGSVETLWRLRLLPKLAEAVVRYQNVAGDARRAL